MSTSLTTLTRTFYWVTVPIYLLLYALAMRGDSHAAFWIEGGKNDFGPYSFYCLIICWIVPLFLGVLLSAAGHKEVIEKNVLAALALSVPCLPGFLFSSPGKPPMIVPHIGDYFSEFWIGMLSVYGVIFSIAGIYSSVFDNLFPELEKIEISEIIKSYGVDNEQLWTQHLQPSQNHDALRLLLNEFKSGSYTSSSEFFGLLERAVGNGYMHRLNLSTINSATISSMKESVFEYRLGRFTSPAEYASFKNGYHRDSLPAHVDEDARKISHPLLIRMYNAGGALKVRAIEISKNRETKVAHQFACPPPPQPANIQSGNLSISRHGQIIMQDMPRGDILTLVMQGSLHLTDHYWSPGMSTWLPLSTIINTQPLNPAKTAERSLTSALVSLFVSWLLTVIIGVLILGLVGYGNSGADGAGRLIGTYVGLLILVRPLFLVIEIISRAITGKRGVDLLAP